MTNPLDALVDNPIYDRLMHGAGWPPRGAMRVVQICIGLVFLILGWLLSPLRGQFTPLNLLAPPVTLIPAYPLVALLFALPAVAMVTAAAITSRYSSPEHFAVLRLTHLTGKKIALGYIEAVTYRLRVLRAVAAGYPIMPAVVVTGLFVVTISPVIVLLCVIENHATKSLIQTGVWIGLRWPKQAVLAAGGASAILMAVPVLLALTAPLFGSRFELFVLLFVMILWPLVIHFVADYTLEAAIVEMNRRRAYLSGK